MASNLLFYAQIMLSYPTMGTPSCAKAVELADVRSLYTEAIRPKNDTDVAGDIDMPTSGN